MSGGWLAPPSDSPGAYCWYYADFSSVNCTAVAIFMVGAPFSPGWARDGLRGVPAARHSAVSFALYRPTSRVWALSDYRDARWEGSDALSVGTSRLSRLPDGRIQLALHERTAPWGRRPVEAVLELEPEVTPGEPLALVNGLPHRWHPIAARARATLTLPQEGAVSIGTGYLDCNRGDEPLGLRLAAWRWTRVHQDGITSVTYALPGEPGLEWKVGPAGVSHRRTEPDPWEAKGGRLTRWALRVPRALHPATGAPRLLESSPFYARLEAQGPGVHALGEVADFRRFRSPAVRWMAHFRSRAGSGPTR